MDWNWLEMAGNGWKLLEIAGHDWKQPVLAENGRKWLKKNCWKWLEIDGNGQDWRGMAIFSWKCFESGNDLKFLEIAKQKLES